MKRFLCGFLFPAISIFWTTALHAQFSPNNIVVLQADSATFGNSPCSLLELLLNTNNPTQVLVNHVPATGVDALHISAKDPAAGFLAGSSDGSLVSFAGVNTSNFNGDVSALNPRVVGAFDINQHFTLATSYTGIAGKQIAAAATIDNSIWFIADQGGLYTNNASAPSNAGNLNIVKSFGGILYVGSNDPALPEISTIAAPGASLVTLPGIPNFHDLIDFSLASSQYNGSIYDILYMTNTDGEIVKYSLVDGTWVSNGSYNVGFPFTSIAAVKAGEFDVSVFLVSGDGKTSGNSVYSFDDEQGYNEPITPAVAPTAIYTAPASAILKGLAFTPGSRVAVGPDPTFTISVSPDSVNQDTVTTTGAVLKGAVTASALSFFRPLRISVSGAHIVLSDYSLPIPSVTIPLDGDVTQPFTLIINKDTTVQDPKTALITLRNWGPGDTLATTTVTILNHNTSARKMRITEYMYDGSDGDFIEFTNTGTAGIDMTNWSFSDSMEMTGTVSLSAFGKVKPGESVILARSDTAAFRAAWGLCGMQKIIGGNPVKLGRADEINLYDNNDQLIDRLTYNDQRLGSVRADGASAWVNTAGLGKNITTDWILSTVGDVEQSITSTGGDIGSPGKSSLVSTYSPCITVVPGAPTIGIDVAATSDLVDGGLTASPAGSFPVSGVIGDPSDPVATIGITLSVGDDDTPVGDLVVTASSSNPTVVPNDHVQLTGTGSSRLVKIIPAAVGYSNITLMVSDGSHFTNYVLNYATSEGTAMGNGTIWSTGIAGASAAIALDNDYMVVGDDDHNRLYVFNRNTSGQAVDTFDLNPGNRLQLTDGNPFKAIMIEAGIASPTMAGRSYWIGSMSNSIFEGYQNKPDHDRILSVDVSGTGTAANFTNTGWITGLRAQLVAWGNNGGNGFPASAADGNNPLAIGGLSVEGAAFAPDNTTLYIGFRAPLVPASNRTQAIIAPIINFETWFNSVNSGSHNASATPANIGQPILFNLGGRGIRDLIRLSNGIYVIVAGSYDTTTNPAIYRWTGNVADAPVQLSSFDLSGMNADAALPVNIAGSLSLGRLQIISNEENKVFYGDGISAVDLFEDNYRKSLVALSVSSGGNVLPLDFQTFTAELQTKSALLNWTYNQPQTVASFDVLRSTNGVDFSSIARVPAATMQTSYSYADANAPLTQVFYRIRANNYSGGTILSTIRVLGAAGPGDPSIRIYPNPVVGNLFTIATGVAGSKFMAVYTSTGSLFQQIQFTETVKDISTAYWPKGYYMLRITLADGSVTTKKLMVD